jgi:hypothetical protein
VLGPSRTQSHGDDGALVSERKKSKRGALLEETNEVVGDGFPQVSTMLVARSVCGRADALLCRLRNAVLIVVSVLVIAYTTTGVRCPLFAVILFPHTSNFR